MHPRLDSRLRRVTLVLAVLATAAALIGVNHRAQKGRNAILKWNWAFEAVESGTALYGTGPATPERPTAEGYPTLPATLWILRPFHSMGPRIGPLAWAVCGAAIAWWITMSAMALAAGRVGAFPGLGQLLVVLIAGRILYSELQHGNLNLLVAGTVVAGVTAWAGKHPFLSGFWFGTGAILKVTPALALLWLIRARSTKGLAGFATGLLVWGMVIPGSWLGFERNLDLAGEWFSQMVAPYLSGRTLTSVQTEHINQSLLGVLARHLTDAVAIEARPPVHPAEVRIGWLALTPEVLSWLHRATAMVILVILWHLMPRRGESESTRDVLARGALLALAMLFLSERSWKHHYVLLPLPLAYVSWLALIRRSKLSWAALAAAGLCFLGTGEGILGKAGADLAEAVGAYFLGGLALFVATGAGLRMNRRDGSEPGDCPCENQGLS